MAAMEGCSRSDRAHSPNTWGVLRLQLHHEKPWHRPGLSNDEIFVMLANEVKACLYELQREHVEYFYKDSGWPAKEEAWNALGQERDVMFAADEVAPDKDGIGTRYGLTYRAAREKVLPDRADHENGVAAENERHWLTRLFFRWAHRVFLQDEVRARLEEARYPVALKEVIRGAFSDLSEFKIGTKTGRRLMDQLGNEEAGQRALALTATRQATIRRLIDDLLEEPFGIQRDFRHLLSEARIGFKLAVREAGRRLYPMPSALIHEDVQCSDTYGLSPGGVFDNALQAQRPGDVGLSLFLDRWGVLFLDRVHDIVRRWTGDEKLDSLMTELIEEVRQFDILASVRQATEKDGPLFSEMAAQMAGPSERTAVERAQGRIVQALLDLLPRLSGKPQGPLGDIVTTSRPSATKQLVPTLLSKFETVPGSHDKWMALLRTEGLVDTAGSFTLGPDAKGKGKLVAAWTAAVEVFGLVAYPQDTQLTRALTKHFQGLTGLDRLDKVRNTMGFSDTVSRYKEALQDD